MTSSPPEITKGLGWKRSLPDVHDHKFDHLQLAVKGPDPKSDLSTNIDWIYDQGKENSCVAHSVASNIRYMRKMLKLPEIDPSRNFIYWEGRAIENDTRRDEGMEIRDGLQVVSNIGIATEQDWGYSSYTLQNAPPATIIAEANKNVVTNYAAVDQDFNTLRTTLSIGHPICFGITVYKSMMTRAVAENGKVPMPGDKSDKILGGHAILLVGHNDSTQTYKFMNSWGPDWGDDGYGYLPYRYVENNKLASDFYVITSFGIRVVSISVKPWWKIW